jgi:hypothetical protein
MQKSLEAPMTADPTPMIMAKDNEANEAKGLGDTDEHGCFCLSQIRPNSGGSVLSKAPVFICVHLCPMGFSPK